MKYLDYKENRKQGTDEFPVAFYHLEPSSPRYEMPYHWHPQQEIIRIISGKFRLILDGEIHELHQGDIVYIRDGISHGGTPENCVYECIVFDLKLLQKSQNACTTLVKKLSKHEYLIEPMRLGEIPKLVDIVDALFEAMSSAAEGYELETIGALYLLFGYIFRHKIYRQSKNTSEMRRQTVKFKLALDYIETHYNENITLTDMANAAGMNPRYFCRFFKEMTDRTPNNYLNYYRIECACEQLASGKISVTEAAINNGFNDISYFIKAFRLQKGVTPGEYMHRNDSNRVG